jgi:hypothetical protein
MKNSYARDTFPKVGVAAEVVSTSGAGWPGS